MKKDKFSIVVIDLDSPLQLSPIELPEKYAKKWQVERTTDFVCLSKGGELLRPTLYRKGGIFGHRGIPEDQDYFMLIKYTEAQYDKKFLAKLKSIKSFGITDKQNPNHLEPSWCILDKQGNEVAEFKDGLHCPYLVKNSIIYSMNGYYYNLLTKERICSSYGSISSKEYIFIEDQFNDDKSKRGVVKISKKDASIELFP